MAPGMKRVPPDLVTLHEFDHLPMMSRLRVQVCIYPHPQDVRLGFLKKQTLMAVQ